MKKATNRAAWRKMFRLEWKEIEIREEIGSFLFRKTRINKVDRAAVILIGTDEVYGLYDDMKYASSRARHFYKKMLRESEKVLLG